MRSQIQGLVGQVTSGLLAAVVAVLVGASFPEPIRVLLLLFAAVWALALYWVGQKPDKKDLIEAVKYLDALYNHTPKLIDESDYYRRLNRVLLLDALSSRQLFQHGSKVETTDMTKEWQVSKDAKTSKEDIIVAAICFVSTFLLPLVHGLVWALCKAEILSDPLEKVLESRLSLALLFLVILAASSWAIRQLPAPNVCDQLTLVLAGVMFWGFGYLAVSCFGGVSSLRPGLLCLTVSLYGMLVLGYLPYRHSIDKGVRHRLEILTLFVGMTFYSAGAIGYTRLFVEPGDLTVTQTLLLMGLLILSGCACIWFCGTQWDLVLDAIIGSCGEMALHGLLLNRISVLAEEAQVLMNSIMGLLPGTGLFAAIMGVLTVANF